MVLQYRCWFPFPWPELFCSEREQHEEQEDYCLYRGEDKMGNLQHVHQASHNAQYV